MLARARDPLVARRVLRATGKVLVACGQRGRGRPGRLGVRKSSLNRKAREARP